MSDKYLLDTNIFVYCFDRSDQKKQRLAESLVKGALADDLGLISSQIVQEFLNIATRKFAQPMTALEARSYLDHVLAPLCEIFPSIALYQMALEVQRERGFSFYDSLVLAAAAQAGCRWVYSEDMQTGRTLQGVTIRNPFAESAAAPVK